MLFRSQRDSEFETRLKQCSVSAFRAAYAVLKNHADAEDITQEAMFKACQSAEQLRHPESLQPWMARIAWRLALNKVRAEHSRARRELHLCPAARQASVVDSVITRDRYSRLHHAIDRLPQPFRLVTVLAGIEEYSIKDVARFLRVSEGTVKSRFFRARQMLKILLTTPQQLTQVKKA